MIKKWKCPQCGSTELVEHNAELTIAREEGAPTYTCGKAALCSECGFTEYLLPQAGLAELRAALAKLQRRRILNRA
jgi:predicted nucleic-acid-binding Zn-ribbon protein